MLAFYQNILEQLDPYKDKAFLLPLDSGEIDKLEKQIGQKFPGYFKEFLQIFGVRQDLIFELFQKEGDFIFEYSNLPKNLKRDFIPIGSLGDDVLMIKVNSEDHNLYHYWSTDNSFKTAAFSFTDLLDQNLDELIYMYDKKPFNTEKHWCVQFSIPTNKEKLLLETLEATLHSEWKNGEVSLAGVYSCEAEIEVCLKKMSVKRQEYMDWASPIYYLNWREPAHMLNQDSYIKEMDRKLANAFADYTLIDYGILALTDE